MVISSQKRFVCDTVAYGANFAIGLPISGAACGTKSSDGVLLKALCRDLHEFDADAVGIFDPELHIAVLTQHRNCGGIRQQLQSLGRIRPPTDHDPLLPNSFGYSLNALNVKADVVYAVRARHRCDIPIGLWKDLEVLTVGNSQIGEPQATVLVIEAKHFLELQSVPVERHRPSLFLHLDRYVRVANYALHQRPPLGNSLDSVS